TFELAGEIYGLETKYVQEVMAVPQLALVPGTPDYLLGIINVRGEILAIFDLSRLFGLPKHETNKRSHLIVFGDISSQFGFIADTVDEVRHVDISASRSGIALLGTATGDIVRGVTANAIIVLDGRTLLVDE